MFAKVGPPEYIGNGICLDPVFWELHNIFLADDVITEVQQ